MGDFRNISFWICGGGTAWLTGDIPSYKVEVRGKRAILRQGKV